MPPSFSNRSIPSSPQDSSHAGCTTCKARKKKCPVNFDEAGCCTECRRLGIGCLRHFPDWMKNPNELQAYRRSIKKDIALQRKLSRHAPASRSRPFTLSMYDAQLEDVKMDRRGRENDFDTISGYAMRTFSSTEQFPVDRTIPESSNVPRLDYPVLTSSPANAASIGGDLFTPPALPPLGPTIYSTIGDSHITTRSQAVFPSLTHLSSKHGGHQMTATSSFDGGTLKFRRELGTASVSFVEQSYHQPPSSQRTT